MKQFVTATVSMSKTQRDFVKDNDLCLSWILQRAINELMDTRIRGAIDFLKEQGFMSIPEYKEVVQRFESVTTDEQTRLSDKELRDELRELETLKGKIEAEISERKEHLKQ